MEGKMESKSPLAWPSGWPRTLIRDRKPQKAWKKPLNDCYKALEKELERLGVENMLISTNIPPGQRGLTGGVEPLDPGVAVYFTRKLKPDFSWQDILGISSPAPTIEDIEKAFREKSRVYHPDNLQTGDIATFQRLNDAQKAAKRWVNRASDRSNQLSIACDKFDQVRLNLTAIRIAIGDLRSLERCGVSGILERAFKGFEMIPEEVDKKEYSTT